MHFKRFFNISSRIGENMQHFREISDYLWSNLSRNACISNGFSIFQAELVKICNILGKYLIICTQNYQEMLGFQTVFAYFQPNQLKYAIFQ